MDLEQEHELYGGDIPNEEADMEANDDMAAADQDPQPSKENLEEMKKRLKEIEEEASALREMQSKAEKEMSAVQGVGCFDAIKFCAGTTIAYSKEEIDRESDGD